MGAAVNDHRLVPYLQRHEFESLVLAAIAELASLVEHPDDLAGVSALATILEDMAPEDVNDGATTAPSKRLLAQIPSYRKTLHGRWP